MFHTGTHVWEGIMNNKGGLGIALLKKCVLQILIFPFRKVTCCFWSISFHLYVSHIFHLHTYTLRVTIWSHHILYIYKTGLSLCVSGLILILLFWIITVLDTISILHLSLLLKQGRTSHLSKITVPAFFMFVLVYLLILPISVDAIMCIHIIVLILCEGSDMFPVFVTTYRTQT